MDRVILRFVYFSVDHPLLWEMQQHNTVLDDDASSWNRGY